MFSTDDTIVALATPRGRGGIGVVRLSGPEAHRIALDLTGRRRPFEPRRATFVRLREDGTRVRTIDHVLVTFFARPRSFTGEDVVEMSGHGSPVLLDEVVRLAVEAGARMAEPGEFTLRAYLNGKLDLVQAEAVADLVEAVTPLQARAAMDQLEGTLTQRIGRIETKMFDLAARLEASLDFPEEGFHFITRDESAGVLEEIERELAELVASGRAGRVIREGRTVVITGPPNAGKSTLFNALVGADRAIVTAVPGTTRDLLTERVDIGGLAITLVDTAGLRDASDAIEAEGVRRAHEAQRIADLAIVVIDGSAPLDEAAREAVATHHESRLIVMSKADCPQAWTPEALGDAGRDALTISVHTGSGIDRLRRSIVAVLTSREEWRDAPAVSNERHLTYLESAAEAVASARAGLASGSTEELLLVDLARAREALEQVTGRRTPEDLLHHIFSRFCVGK